MSYVSRIKIGENVYDLKGSGVNIESAQNGIHNCLLTPNGSDPIPTYSSGISFVVSDEGNTMNINGDIQGNNFYATSDEKLKNIQSSIELTAKQIADFPSIKFTWKDNRDNKVHVGTTAQSIQNVIPELVSKDNNSNLVLDYSALGVTAAIALAKEVVALKEEIKQLKSKIK